MQDTRIWDKAMELFADVVIIISGILAVLLLFSIFMYLLYWCAYIIVAGP